MCVCVVGSLCDVYIIVIITGRFICVNGSFIYHFAVWNTQSMYTTNARARHHQLLFTISKQRRMRARYRSLVYTKIKKMICYWYYTRIQLSSLYVVCHSNAMNSLHVISLSVHYDSRLLKCYCIVFCVCISIYSFISSNACDFTIVEHRSHKYSPIVYVAYFSENVVVSSMAGVFFFIY